MYAIRSYYVPSKEVYKIVHCFNKDIFRYDIQDFCAKYGINQRRLERIFNKYIGVSPKRLHKITQCKHILNCLKYMGSNSLTTLAYDCGFYDRITSYNVCYTKLLRLLREKESFDF